jgi:transcriptional regulator with XRE-family HTH domain
MSKFPNHLRDFRLATGISQPELAKLSETNVQNVSRIERGERKLTQEWADLFAPHLGTTAREMMFPTIDKLEQLSKAAPRTKPPAEGAPELEYVPLDDDAEWLPTSDAGGEGYNRDNYQPHLPGAIPELDAKAGAGEGAVGEVLVLPMGSGTISAHKITGEWVIPPEYLREAVRNPERAIVLPINGDSMLPNYAPGDRVIIDLSEHELRADGVYLISDGVNAPQIKRLQIVQFSRPRKCRIISDNPAYQPQEVETDMVHIMGKVSAYVGRR